MTVMLVAPTEPPPIKVLGTVSSVPEKYGADVLWVSQKMGCAIGVQRKEIKDLVASVQDGRLGKEVAQMQELGQGVLVVEGRLRWSTDGELMADRWTRWNRAQHRGLLASVQSRGIWVQSSDDMDDTVTCVQELARYLEKDRHDALDRRPKPQGTWGVADHRAWGSHLLQSVPGIGPALAERIFDHFGRVPMAWTVGVAELQEVDGVGKMRAQSLIEALAERGGSGAG